ncbi:para-nitrobenzyl esterase [Silvibacterium bohemicum]|uniref:Carboxylic ester hydrolase n=1 Tax=Silvibacterium bohemicum TaxID=1577686 RepID=A0A841JWA9_9BACT|nr:carboxylesterase family protein [Silvibacterium bohemicum]MBB6142274.1 para-nitrobenzyl esterase [Silvibacterium bohemicum]
MRPLFVSYLLAAASLLTPAIAAAQDEAPGEAKTVVRVAQGDLAGIPAQPYSPILVFKAIPYAAPPTGDLRWREPQPPASWNGVRDATHYGAVCTQVDGSIHFPHSTMSEDCLTLNLWTPSLKPVAPAPVMVYIHGGGFVVGSASDSPLNGNALATRGAVVVSINYRLGVFGFLAHPDLTRESPHHASGNYGLMDQIAALRWVRQNIAAFGGDARNITVFGESAGATSIGYLLVSPLAAGNGNTPPAFDKAILESPSDLFTPDSELHAPYRGLTNMEAVGTAIAPTIAELRQLPAGEVMARATAATNKLFGPSGSGHARLRPEGHTQNPTVVDTPWWAFVDGYVVPDQHARLFTENRGLRIPVLVGTNTDEGTSFVNSLPAKTAQQWQEYVTQTFSPCGKQLLDLYSAPVPEKIHAASDHLVTDALFLYGAFETARAEHAFLYRFTRIGPESAKANTGAFHTAELDYVFGLTHAHPERYDSTDHRLSDKMMTAWLHFARTGDPRLMESTEWTRIGSNGETPYMEFGDTVTVKDLPDTTFRVFEQLWPPSGKASSCPSK